VEEEFCAYVNAPVELFNEIVPFVGGDVMEKVVVPLDARSAPCK
jgi:hypothetical protein